MGGGLGYIISNTSKSVRSRAYQVDIANVIKFGRNVLIYQECWIERVKDNCSCNVKTSCIYPSKSLTSAPGWEDLIHLEEAQVFNTVLLGNCKHMTARYFRVSRFCQYKLDFVAFTNQKQLLPPSRNCVHGVSSLLSLPLRPILLNSHLMADPPVSTAASRSGPSSPRNADAQSPPHATTAPSIMAGKAPERTMASQTAVQENVQKPYSLDQRTYPTHNSATSLASTSLSAQAITHSTTSTAEARSLKEAMEEYQLILDRGYLEYEGSLRGRDSGLEIGTMDWEELEAKYSHDVGPRIHAEQDLIHDCENLFQVRRLQFHAKCGH